MEPAKELKEKLGAQSEEELKNLIDETKKNVEATEWS